MTHPAEMSCWCGDVDNDNDDNSDHDNVTPLFTMTYDLPVKKSEGKISQRGK